MLVLIFIFCLPSAYAADSEIDLAPIIKKENAESPIDLLTADPVLPASDGQTEIDSSSGTIQRSLEDQLPYPVSDNGNPAGFSQFRGLGKSVEDINVQTLGIPLNGPQGGGFNLSTFPEFFWSRYRFQQGPSLATFDPDAVSGNLTLTPWTADALTQEGSGSRETGFYSTEGLGSVSAGIFSQNRYAVLVGESFGNAQGPTVGLSMQWETGDVKFKFHLLATDIDSNSPGTVDFPTPNADVLTERVIPVFQTDVPLSENALMKNSVFYDGTYLTADNTADRIQQFGTENSILVGDWRMGANLREAFYHGLTVDAPDQSIVDLQLGRTIESDFALIDPSAQLVYVNGFGALPEGSIGARKELPENLAAYARFSASRKIPTLDDRYYVLPGFFTGNPGLEPETDFTETIGTEWKGKRAYARLEGFTQQRESVQVLSGTTVVNGGTANVSSLLGTAKWNFTEKWNAFESTSFTASRLASGLDFPYLPWLTEVLGISYEEDRWSAQASARAQSSSVDSNGQTLGGYAYLDLGAKFRVIQSVDLEFRMEDVLDRAISTIAGYPSIGRSFSLLLFGKF